MSVVSLVNVSVLNNPAKFNEKYQFEITFECLESLAHDLEWKLTYVGSATSSEHDIVLDSLLVGPVPVGVNKFVFEAEAPKPNSIPASELLGVTVLLLTCSYDGREFVRVGYYVNNEYDTPELNAEPPKVPIVDRIVRNLLAEKPRVTRFAIKWDSDDSAPPEFPPEQPEADLAPDDADTYGAEEAELEDDEDEEEVAGGAEGDTEMGGADDTAGGPAEEDLGDESEDLEGESEDDEEDDEMEVEDAMEVEAAPNAPSGTTSGPPPHA
ncbi:histone deposition protein Asf1 [Ascobolus immersus RN42]|uniref:Histone chaperone n=1 Tax=Ascobolus immersus RN42 TaxID=1160509 RepID=A0A3N4HU29_ASCIM|nr:histone deposition protein Asf1 [Ascobolus immersus RN42]